MANAYGHKVKNIDGAEVDLAGYRGKVTLFVNVASQCGYTPQYEGLEQLHEKFHGRPFEVLGFPSNDFGAQEPGSEAEIKQFCSLKYDVTFPMFSKVKVSGPEKAALYETLAEQFGQPKWNFHKYLVGKGGEVLQAFPSKVEPMSKELVEAIESALAK